MIAYGPVPSRRLGKSLGINNIPPKSCTYSCAYCQVGRTLNMEVEPRRFYGPEELSSEVRQKVENALEAGEHIDYLSFVPDGEPTLDVNIGKEIRALKDLGIKTAVITNASLLWRPEVRDSLMAADWVSVKVDAADSRTWRRINRPHRYLELESVLDGIVTFAESFDGELTTETMLVDGVNDSEKNAKQVGEFLSRLNPDIAYVSIPTRPPAETWACAPAEEVINRFYQVVSSHTEHTEHLIGYEGNAFASTGSVEDDLLSITAVHPMRREAVERLLERAGATWSVVDNLVERNKLAETAHRGDLYYMRTLPSQGKP